MELLNGTLGVVVVIGLLIFLFVWTFLPFAIFGTKPLLRDILAALRRLEDSKIDLTVAANPSAAEAIEKLRENRKPRY